MIVYDHWCNSNWTGGRPNYLKTKWLLVRLIKTTINIMFFLETITHKYGKKNYY